MTVPKRRPPRPHSPIWLRSARRQRAARKTDDRDQKKECNKDDDGDDVERRAHRVATYTIQVMMALTIRQPN